MGTKFFPPLTLTQWKKKVWYPLCVFFVFRLRLLLFPFPFPLPLPLFAASSLLLSFFFRTGLGGRIIISSTDQWSEERNKLPYPFNCFCIFFVSCVCSASVSLSMPNGSGGDLIISLTDQWPVGEINDVPPPSVFALFLFLSSVLHCDSRPKKETLLIFGTGSWFSPED